MGAPISTASREASPPRATGGRTAGHWWLAGGGLLAAVALVVLGAFLTPAEAGVGTHEQLGLPACSTMRFYVSSQFGLERGFDRLADELIRCGTRNPVASEVVDRFLEQLDELGDDLTDDPGSIV